MTLIQCCDLSLGYEGKCVLSHLELTCIILTTMMTSVRTAVF